MKPSAGQGIPRRLGSMGATLAVSALVAVACGESAKCETDAECSAPAFCSGGRCQSPGVTIVLPGADLATTCDQPPVVQYSISGGRSPDWVGLVVNGLEQPMPSVAVAFPCDVEGTFEIRVRAHFGDHVVESASRTIRVDRTPPHLAWDPPAGYGSLPQRSALVGTFDEPIEAASLPPGSVALEADGPPGPVAFELSPDGMRLTVPLPRPASQLTWIQVTLPDRVSDLAGNILYSRRFIWQQPPILLSLTPSGEPYWPYIPGDLALTLGVDGPNADSVSLEVYWTGFAEIPIPGPPWPTEVRWDAGTFPDGGYTVSAKAVRGEASFRSPPVSFVLDRTAPVASVVPSPSLPAGGGISVSQPLSIVFSEQVLTSTLGPMTVLVTGPDGGPVPFRLDWGGWPVNDRAQIWLDPVPAAPTALDIELTPGILDRAGHSIARVVAHFDAPLWLTWRTRQPPAGGACVAGGCTGWGGLWAEVAPGAPSAVRYGPLSDGEVLNADPTHEAADPVLARDRYGSPTFAWVELGATGRWSLQVRRQDWNWQGFQGLLPEAQRDPTRDARTPALGTWASGSFDLPVVAWVEESSAGARSLHVSRFDGAAWVAMGDDLGLGSPTTPAIAVDGGGATWLAWVETPAGVSGTLYVRRADGDVFDLPDALGLGWAGGAASPSLAHDPTGRPAIAWSEGTGPDAAVALRRWDGSAWSSAALVPGGESPVLAFDATGSAVVAYVEAATGLVRVARHDGITWRDAGAPVGEQRVRPGTTPHLSIGELDAAYVLFTDETGALRLLFENR